MPPSVPGIPIPSNSLNANLLGYQWIQVYAGDKWTDRISFTCTVAQRGQKILIFRILRTF